MAVKLDTDKKLFLGATPVREGTVQDVVRQTVRDLNGGDGVSYAELETHMLANFTPKKSDNYGAPFIKAYVRDAVNKYGYLSHEDLGLEYSTIAATPKAAAEPKPKKLTKAQQAEIDTLNFIVTKGEVLGSADLDGTMITVQDFVTETGKKTKTVENNLAKLEAAGLIRTEEVDGNEEGTKVTYVYLTEAGYTHAQSASAPAAEAEAA